MTRGIAALCDENFAFPIFVLGCLHRHREGDWGDVDAEDKRLNDRALDLGERIVSVYHFNGTKVYIITEWDRSVTTVLLPEEY
jgi:hypothetical protein